MDTTTLFPELELKEKREATKAKIGEFEAAMQRCYNQPNVLPILREKRSELEQIEVGLRNQLINLGYE